MVKFCGKCGAKLDENTGFCPNCNADELKKVQKPGPVASNEGETNNHRSASTEERFSKREARKQRKEEIKTEKKEERAGLSISKKILRFLFKLILIILLIAVLVIAALGALVYFDIVDIPEIEKIIDRVELLPNNNERDIETDDDSLLENFTSNENCFWENEQVNVVFSVSVQGKKPDYVDLYEYSDDKIVCKMFDNGKNGDSFAGDGIYANTISVVSELGSKSYYCKTEEYISEMVYLYFFERPTEESVSEIQKIQANIIAIEETFCGDDGYVKESDLSAVMEEVEGYAENLYKNGDVLYYEVSDNSILLKFKNGLTYIYLPKRYGIDAIGENVNISVFTFQPCLNTYSSEMNEYMILPDLSAEKISEKLSLYKFNAENNYDNQEVTLNKIKALSENQVIIWHGHGGYSDSLHSYLLTGEEFDYDAFQSDSNYRLDNMENRIVECLNGNVAFTSKYIDKYCNNLNGTFLYLAACQSGKDNVLADSFLRKGAKAVVANSETICTDYNLLVQNATLENMTHYNEKTGRLYTLGEALAMAKKKYGENDSKYGNKEEVATPLIFGEKGAENFVFNNDERDIVLVLDVSGSMSGRPIEETRKASVNFIDTILEENASIGVVTYDNYANRNSDFSLNKESLESIVSDIHSGGGTNIEAGLKEAHSMLSASTAKKKIIVLMSDGEPNNGKVGDDLVDYADEIKKDGVLIYTLGFFENLGGYKSFAQQLMERIASDGCHYEVANADDLMFFFGDMADQINGQKYIYVRIACPVDVSVTYEGQTLSSSEKDLNLRTDFGTLSFEQDEEDLANGIDDRVKVLRLKEGADYDLKLIGTGHGIMDYTIGFMDDNGNYSDLRRFENVKITKKTVIDTKAAVSDQSTLNIDENGDGKYDVRLRAGENSYGEEIKQSKLTYFVIGGCSLLCLLFVVITVHKVKRRNAGR